MATIIWTLTPTVKEITLPTGNTYYLKDADVRAWVGDGITSGAEKRISDAETAIAALSNATHWLGITTTSLADGATTNPITINGESVTAVSGDIVQDVNANEFIFNGATWQLFGGSIGTLKAFAFVDTGDVTVTSAGTNASSAVTGTCSVTPSGTIGVGTGAVNYTPAGTISGTAVTLTSGSVASVTNVGEMPGYTVTDEVLTISAGSVPTVSNVAVATGVDTVTDPSFTGTGTSLAFTGTASSGTISGTAAAQTFTGTPTTYTVYPTH